MKKIFILTLVILLSATGLAQAKKTSLPVLKSSTYKNSVLTFFTKSANYKTPLVKVTIPVKNKRSAFLRAKTVRCNKKSAPDCILKLNLNSIATCKAKFCPTSKDVKNRVAFRGRFFVNVLDKGGASKVYTCRLAKKGGVIDCAIKSKPTFGPWFMPRS